jgi:hypothetical protein
MQGFWANKNVILKLLKHSISCKNIFIFIKTNNHIDQNINILNNQKHLFIQ